VILGNGSGYVRKESKRHVYGVARLIFRKELKSDTKKNGNVNYVDSGITERKRSRKK
jgi:hypothetical protein